MKLNGKIVQRVGWITVAVLGTQLLIQEDPRLLIPHDFFDAIDVFFYSIVTVAYACIPVLLLTMGIRKTKTIPIPVLYGALFSFIGMGIYGTFYIQKYIIGEIGFNGWFAIMPFMLSLPQLIGFPLGWVAGKIHNPTRRSTTTRHKWREGDR